MVQYKTEALVLRSRKYKETDGILTLLTHDRGKVSAVAKGIYKPTSKLRGGVQPFSLNEMMLNVGRSNLQTLLQSDCLEMFLPLRQDLDAMTAASYWAELLDVFAMEEQQDDQLFQLALAGFYGLASQPSAMLMHALEIRLIKQLGYGPSLEVCSSCGGQVALNSKVKFSIEAGGLLCPSCMVEHGPVMTINPIIVSLWRSLENISISKLDRIKVQPDVLSRLDKTIKAWIGYHSGKQMKSWQVFKKMGGMVDE